MFDFAGTLQWQRSTEEVRMIMNIFLNYYLCKKSDNEDNSSSKRYNHEKEHKLGFT
jgi:hypothetical protein